MKCTGYRIIISLNFVENFLKNFEVFSVKERCLFLASTLALYNSRINAAKLDMDMFQFVEIKASLFKKVDVNHLYQIACSDVKERFHYVILLSVVCIRNMNENSWDTGTDVILYHIANLVFNVTSTHIHNLH